MWFLKNRSSSPVANAQAQASRNRAAETEAALTRGVLPSSVGQRLQEMKNGDLPWTSDLSVNEWLCIRSLGFRPVGQVMGSSVYHIGYSAKDYSGTWISRDLPDPERALYEGRRLALQRLREEAQSLGANAVVGVKIDVRASALAGHHMEFVSFGTAVVLDGLAVPPSPILCTVSGQDLCKLVMAGSLPVGLTMGVCVHYHTASRNDMWQMNSWANREVQTLSEAVYHTRNKAIRNMQQEARSLQATTVLAHETKMFVEEVEVERGENDERKDHIIEFFSMGTAVASQGRQQEIGMSVVLDLV